MEFRVDQTSHISLTQLALLAQASFFLKKKRRETYRQKAAEYVARIEKTEFLLGSSCKIASVKSAVASTG